MWKPILLLIMIFGTLLSPIKCCIHDTFALNTTKHFLHDFADKRLLA